MGFGDRHATASAIALIVASGCAASSTSATVESTASTHIATTTSVRHSTQGVLLAPASHESSYHRDLFGSGWSDEDGDCQDTRDEVLAARSTAAPMFDLRGCNVVTGRWIDPWSGEVVTDAHALQIDHH